MKKIIRLTESDLTRIVRRAINEMESDEPDYGSPNYDGSKWYDKMREYEQYLADVRKKSQEHRELCDNCVWNGFYYNTPDLRSIVYFDNMDENEVQEILNKIDEIAEYTKRGHDPAWQISMRKRLGNLKHLMLWWKDQDSDFYRKVYGRQLQYFDRDKGESFPYEFNK